MKKDGFTLVELLAVIIILAILYLFVMPKVTDLIKDGNKTDKYIIQNKIITAAKEYASNYDTSFLNDFINVGYSKYISKEDLINNKLLDENELDSIGFFKVKVTLKEDNKLEYTISYDDSEKVLLSVNLDGGSIISNPSGEYDVGSTIILNTPTKTDYEFSHWSIEVGNSILSGNMLTIGNTNTTIKANWNKRITLTIDLNGGIGNNQGGIYSSKTTLTLEEPMKDNYVFAGWELINGNSVLSENMLTIGNTNTTIKANWIKKITLTIDLNGGTGNNQGGIYSPKTTLTLEEPMKDNYILVGWKIASGDAIVSGNNITFGLEDVSLIAIWAQDTYEFAYTGDVQTFSVPKNGKYKIELWGASGVDNSIGSGAYTSGIINLNVDEKLYVYVGQMSKAACSPYYSCGGLTFNGGGEGGYFTVSHYLYRSTSGAGATDVRLVSGNWNNSTSLRSRIMVAGGGGGGSGLTGEDGSAGGLIGYSGSHGTTSGIVVGTGGTQISGGTGKYAGSFGTGGNGYILNASSPNNNDAGGAGSGYYGGGGGQSGASTSNSRGGVANGGGGSSYISGHTGCVAITSSTNETPKTGCTTGTSDNSCSIHYSGKMFTNTIMIDGQGYNWTNKKCEQVQMPSPSGVVYASGKGHHGNGYAKITYIGE